MAQLFPIHSYRAKAPRARRRPCVKALGAHGADPGRPPRCNSGEGHGARMALIRIPEGGLWAVSSSSSGGPHSPVPPGLRNEPFGRSRGTCPGGTRTEAWPESSSLGPGEGYVARGAVAASWRVLRVGENEDTRRDGVCLSVAGWGARGRVVARACWTEVRPNSRGARRGVTRVCRGDSRARGERGPHGFAPQVP